MRLQTESQWWFARSTETVWNFARMGAEKKVRGTSGSTPRTPVTTELATMAKIVAAERKRLGLTQKEFAELVGVSQGQVSKMENPKGLAGVRLISACRMATSLKLTLDQLVLGYPNFLALALQEAQRQGIELPIAPPSLPPAPDPDPGEQPKPVSKRGRRPHKPRG